MGRHRARRDKPGPRHVARPYPMWVYMKASARHSREKPKSQSLRRGGSSSVRRVLSSFKSLGEQELIRQPKRAYPMCVYILESPVQPFAKPKSQSLMMGGKESPNSARSSSVLSSFKSLQGLLVFGRGRQSCAPIYTFKIGRGRVGFTWLRLACPGWKDPWQALKKMLAMSLTECEAYRWATKCSWQYSTALMNCCKGEIRLQSKLQLK